MIRTLVIFFASISLLAGTPNYFEDYSGEIAIGSHSFATEIANTPSKMQRGMMFRPRIADNQAMLFVYNRPQQANFWMKNTLIPLDMLFFDANGELLEIKHNVPPCKTRVCPTYPSRAENIQFIVELKGGGSEKLGIQVGQRLHVHAL